MRVYKRISAGMLLTLLLGFRALAQQQPDEIVIQLTKTNEVGTLEVSLISGSIKVVGTTGKDVVVKAAGEELPRRDRDGGIRERVVVRVPGGEIRIVPNPKEEEGGLRRISNTRLDLSFTEQNNRVQITNGSRLNHVSLEIQVPQKFNLKVSSVNNGKLEVSNVTGSLELNNVNGNILLENVSGNAIANTTNGNVKANFLQWDSKYPMAFSTLNGNVDVTVPANANFDVKLNSSRGNIYTDFEIASTPSKIEAAPTKRSESGLYKVNVSEVVSGRVNGGGVDIMMRNMNGNIYLRSGKK